MILSNNTSTNRIDLATCLRHSTQIRPHGWTSDTLGMLNISILQSIKVKT